MTAFGLGCVADDLKIEFGRQTIASFVAAARVMRGREQEHFFDRL
jgi:hypothetical protein